MAIFSKGADPEALEQSAERLKAYAQTCLEVRDSVGTVAVAIKANWAHDGASTALTAGALFAPPPADCGVGALGIAAYQNIPVVHDVVDGAVSDVTHAATAVADTVSHAASGAWHAVTSIF